MNEVDKIVEGFLSYLKQTDQLDLLPRVVELLSNEVMRQIQRVRVVSAVPLKTGDLEKIVQIIAERFGPQVIVEAEVDPQLMGGVQVRFGDRLIDLSVAGSFKRVKRLLKS